jgi:membrane-associated phospholipid phosphatase
VLRAPVRAPGRLGAAPHRRAPRRGQGPPPPNAVVEPLWRSLLKASYPSTIALTIGAAIALAANPSLAAVLAGILAGLGIAALIAVSRVYLWERELHGRLLAERKRGGRIFLRAA